MSHHNANPGLRFRLIGSNRPNISTDWSLILNFCWCLDSALGNYYVSICFNSTWEFNASLLRGSVACGKTVGLIIISMCFLMCMCNYFDMSLFLQAFPNPGKVGISDPKGITETRPRPGQWWDLCAHDTGPFETTIRLVLSCAAEWVEGRNRSAMCICTHRCRKWMNLNEKLWVRNMWKWQVTSPSSHIFPRSSLSTAM